MHWFKRVLNISKQPNLRPSEWRGVMAKQGVDTSCEPCVTVGNKALGIGLPELHRLGELAVGPQPWGQ